MRLSAQTGVGFPGGVVAQGLSRRTAFLVCEGSVHRARRPTPASLCGHRGTLDRRHSTASSTRLISFAASPPVGTRSSSSAASGAPDVKVATTENTCARAGNIPATLGDDQGDAIWRAVADVIQAKDTSHGRPDPRQRESHLATSYLNRRRFMRAGLLFGGCRRNRASSTASSMSLISGRRKSCRRLRDWSTAPHGKTASGWTKRRRRARRSCTTTIFYEFSTDKDGVASAAAEFQKRRGWQVAGRRPGQEAPCVRHRRTQAAQRARGARLSDALCRSLVDGDSRGVGYSLSKLLDVVEPTPEAQFVAFETLHDPNAHARTRRPTSLKWPYVEGLRLDEAMHPLAILANRPLRRRPCQHRDGAPVRPRHAVEVRLQGHQVESSRSRSRRPCRRRTWGLLAPGRIRFSTGNVQSQSRPSALEPGRPEQRIGESGRRKHADVQRLRRAGWRSCIRAWISMSTSEPIIDGPFRQNAW